jgi:voltage-gated potassium channel
MDLPERMGLKFLNKKELRHKIGKVIFGTDSFEGLVFDVSLLVLILVSVLIVMLESVPSIGHSGRIILRVLDWVITIVFTIEYGLRIWTILRPRRYIFSFFGVIDLLSILPLFLELIFVNTYSLGVIRAIRLLRIFRVLKLVQFVGEAQIILDSLKSSMRKILVFLFFIMIVCTVIGSVMYVLEGAENGFTSIPRSVYWAVVTITTVGYGDISPQTGLGQFLAMLLMIMGYGVIAVPTGLVVADVAKASQQKDDAAKNLNLRINRSEQHKEDEELSNDDLK